MPLVLTSPAWLLAWLLVGLVWWLHRFRQRGDSRPVAALFLWRVQQDEPQRGPSKVSQPELIWLLRALIVVLLVAALSGPRWRTVQWQPLTIWLDDSVSMQVVEQRQTRMYRALTEVAQVLTAAPYREVVLRSLGDPATVMSWVPSDRAEQLFAFGREPRGEPQLPAPAAMSEYSEHWLVSDGVAAGLGDWVRRAPLSKVVQVGQRGDNVAVTALALRRNGDSSQLAIISRNAGEHRAQRTLMVYEAQRLVKRWSLSIDPGDSVVRQILLHAPLANTLTARLMPPDALLLDDQLSLDVSAVHTIDFALFGQCSAFLRAALTAHPGLKLVTHADFERGLRVVCSNAPVSTSGTGPTLLVSPGPFAEVLDGGDVAAGSSELQLQRAWLRVAALDDAVLNSASSERLLSVGEQPLVMFDRQRQHLYIALDLNHAPLVRQPQFPLLIASLVAQLLDLDDAWEGLSEMRRMGEEVITPTRLPMPEASSASVDAQIAVSLAKPLLGIVLALLALDVVLLYARGRGQRGKPVPEQAE